MMRSIFNKLFRLLKPRLLVDTDYYIFSRALSEFGLFSSESLENAFI